MRHNCFRTDERPGQVDGECFFPLGKADLRNWQDRTLNPGIVYENIDAFFFCEHPIDSGSDRVLVGYVDFVAFGRDSHWHVGSPIEYDNLRTCAREMADNDPS